MSGVMKPFETLFGVVISRSSSRRALMLPSFDATYRARAHAPAGFDDVGTELFFERGAHRSVNSSRQRAEQK